MRHVARRLAGAPAPTVFLLAVAVVLAIASLSTRARADNGTIAKHLRIEAADHGISRIRLRLTRSVRVSVFTLPSPYRLVLDLPEVRFALQVRTEPSDGGLVRDFRHGLIASGHSRLIFDLAGPFKLVDVRARELAAGQSEIQLDIGRVSAGNFRPQGVPPRLPAAAALQAAVKSGRPDRDDGQPRRPLVMLDPGHGGPDPGAIGLRGISEKDVVLAVAQRIARRLRRSGRFDVVLTRERDVFISLDDRVALSRARQADIFISLHADSIAARQFAARVRGASLYTLSEVASDRKAEALAAKENATDALAGLNIATGLSGGRVEAILFDLMRRETSGFSKRLREHLLQRLKRSIRLSGSPRRAAAFRVLRQPDTPSVLLELGYMSNPNDVQEMTRPAWQASAANAIVLAIEAYFTERDG